MGMYYKFLKQNINKISYVFFIFISLLSLILSGAFRFINPLNSILLNFLSRIQHQSLDLVVEGVTNIEKWSRKLNFALDYIMIISLSFIVALFVFKIISYLKNDKFMKPLFLILSLITVFISSFYLISILMNSSFVFFWDDTGLASGVWQPFIGGSRFCPLAGIQFLPIILLGFGGIPIFYYITNAIIFILTLIGLIILARYIFKNQPQPERKLFTILTIMFYLLLGPLVAQVYFRANILEASISFLVVYFLICFVKGFTGKPFYYIFAFILANVIIYTKEFNFVPMLTIGLFMVSFLWKQLNKQSKIFAIGLIISSILFLCVYFIFVPTFSVEKSYLSAFSSDNIIMGLIKNIVNMHFLPVVLLVIALNRIYYIVIKKQNDLLLLDLLYFSGLSIFAVHFVVKFTFSWYYVPAYLMIAIPLIQYINVFFTNKKKYATLMVCYFVLLFCLNTFTNVSSIVSNQTARKNDMVFAEKILDEMQNQNIPLYCANYQNVFFEYLLHTKNKWDKSNIKIINKIPDSVDPPGLVFEYGTFNGYSLLMSDKTSNYDCMTSFRGLFLYIDNRLIVKSN